MVASVVALVPGNGLYFEWHVSRRQACFMWPEKDVTIRALYPERFRY